MKAAHHGQCRGELLSIAECGALIPMPRSTKSYAVVALTPDLTPTAPSAHTSHEPEMRADGSRLSEALWVLDRPHVGEHRQRADPEYAHE
jgi:hypothetical protein